MQPQMAPGGLSVQLAHRAHTSDWTLLAVDVAAALAAQDVSYRCIRSLQLCAAMSVRGAFTSNVVHSPKVTCATSWCGWCYRCCTVYGYGLHAPKTSKCIRSLQTLPRDMVICQKAEVAFTDICWLPQQPLAHAGAAPM